MKTSSTENGGRPLRVRDGRTPESGYTIRDFSLRLQAGRTKVVHPFNRGRSRRQLSLVSPRFGGNKGMTLLEIMVVLAIIGVLSAILIPSMERIKLAARSNQCVGKLREIGIGMSNYFLDHGTTFPTMVAARESRDEDVPAIDTVLLDYVKDETLFQCPSDHAGIFEKTGSSYLWNSLINGQKMGNMDLLGLTESESGIPTVSDKENFHKHVGDGVNILYADGHVSRNLQLTVGR